MVELTWSQAQRPGPRTQQLNRDRDALAGSDAAYGLASLRIRNHDLVGLNCHRRASGVLNLNRHSAFCGDPSDGLIVSGLRACQLKCSTLRKFQLSDEVPSDFR